MSRPINEAEIARLMKAMEEPLRRSWEAKVIEGRRLEDIVQSRTAAIAKRKSSMKYLKVMFLVFGLLAILSVSRFSYLFFLFVPAVISREAVLTALTTLGFLAAAIWAVSYWARESDNAQLTIDRCESILEDFQATVDTLNLCRDGQSRSELLTREVVIVRLTRMAYKVIDAEDWFEGLFLLRPGRKSSDVSQASANIQESQKQFNFYWEVATLQAGLRLEKGQVFAEATRKFLEHHNRMPAHLAKKDEGTVPSD
jgi:hypothetical protein